MSGEVEPGEVESTNAGLVRRFKCEYQDYHRISRERAGQQRRLLMDLGRSLDGGRTLAEAQAEDITRLAGQWLDSGLHVNTVRKRLNMIRPFYSWAYAARVITPLQYMDIKEVRNPRGSSGTSTPKPYTRTEVISFWHALDRALPLLPESGKGSQAIKRFLDGRGLWRRVWKHAMRLQVDCAVRLALDLGLRRHEMFNLSVDDLHYENEYVVVYGKADPRTGEKKRRVVPFTDRAREAARLWLEFRRTVMKPDHDRVWLACWGSRTYNHPMLERRFNTLLQSLVGEHWRWHRFRHTCATNWLRAGAKLETVQRLLGHATLSQTLAYAEILESDVAEQLGAVESEFAAISGPEVVTT